MREHVSRLFLIKDPGLVRRVILVLLAQIGAHDAARSGLVDISKLASEVSRSGVIQAGMRAHSQLSSWRSARVSSVCWMRFAAGGLRG